MLVLDAQVGRERVESHEAQTMHPSVKADFKGVTIGQSLSDAIGILQRAGYTYGYNWANKDNEIQVETQVMRYAGEHTGYISYMNNVPQNLRANNDDTCPYMTQVHFFAEGGGAILCGTDEAGKGFDFKRSRVVRIIGIIDVPRTTSVEAFLETARRKYPDLPNSPGFRDGVSYRVNNPQDPVVLIAIGDSIYGEAVMKSVRHDAEASSQAPF
jgi:hypothetical protein